MRHLAGTGAMVRLVLRRDRVRLPVWLAAIVGLVWVSAAAVAEAYGTPEQIQAYARSVGGSPTAVAMAGPPYALTEVGGILVYETSLTALVGIALMAVFLTVRHTRGDEDEGRTELLRSTVVGRYAHAAAVTFVLAVASLVVGAGVTLSLLSVEGVPVPGALVYGASVAVFGVVFTAVALVAAQVMSHRRTAVGVAMSVLGLSYLLRAVGDVGDGTLSWLSPMGWSQRVAAFEENRWWPLLPSVGLAVALLGTAAVLVTRRDLGAGLVPPRPGPATASRLLSGPTGLAWRLQRGSVLGWASGVLLFGLVMGSFSQELLELVESNPLMEEFFAQQGGSVTDAYFAVILVLLALLAGAFSVASVLRVRGEEAAGHAESLLATPVSRTRWLLASLAVTLLGTLVVLLSGGLGVATASAWVGDDAGLVGPLLLDTLVYLPAALVLGALAVVLVGVAPGRALLAWLIVAYCFVLGYLGNLLDPPGWMTALSPFSHTPEVPMEPVAGTPLLVLTAVVLVGVAAGAAGFRRRDLRG